MNALQLTGLIALIAVALPNPIAPALANEATGQIYCRLALRPLPGHKASIARALSDRGWAAGMSSGGGEFVAVKWDRDRRPSLLPPLTGDRFSEAAAINGQGEVAGTSRGATLVAVRWDRHGEPVRLPPLPGDRESQAFGINDDGVVAGVSRARGGVGGRLGGLVESAVVWDTFGKPRRLELPAGFEEGTAHAIDDRGQVVGFVYRTGSPHDRAVKWTSTGEPRLLRRLDELRDSEAYAIAADGVVAGESDDPRLVATLWSPGPHRLRRVEGATSTAAFGLNDGRQAAGFATLAGKAVALRWDASGRPHPLPPLAGDGQAQAFAINGSGVIAGVSIGSGRSRGILWRPGRCAD